MDFSYLNTTLWGGMLQIGIVCAMVIIANILRRKVPIIRKSLMPTAVLAGFIALVLKYCGLLPVSQDFMEAITYHAIGLGFIALSLKVPQKSEYKQSRMVGPRSGALIASTYVIQGIVGLIITLGLAYTIMPDMFKAAGVLLPMGYGQGPGQANNIGSSYEQLGFVGGQSFGLAIAAVGFLVACVVGVIYLNYLKRSGKILIADKDDNLIISGSVTVEQFQDENEIPISESIDRLSINVAIVLVIYALTYLVSFALTQLLASIGGFAETLISLIWGFNFIIGAVLAILCRTLFSGLRKAKWMTHQYQNNYLLSRLSGVAFDFMVVAGIVSIEINNLSGLVLPFILLCVVGGVVTFFYLLWICKKLYPDYFYEGFVSMFGMMTGTISSGVLLLREIDKDFATPAANNLLLGTSFGILFGAPILLLVGIAPAQPWLVLGILAVYMVLLLIFMLKSKKGASS